MTSAAPELPSIALSAIYVHDIPNRNERRLAMEPVGPSYPYSRYNHGQPVYGSQSVGGLPCTIEQADPPIRALGITDYWNLNDYQTVRDYKKAGRLSALHPIH